MSKYLARLKEVDDRALNNTPDIEPTKPTKAAFDGFDGLPAGHIKKMQNSYLRLSV